MRLKWVLRLNRKSYAVRQDNNSLLVGVARFELTTFSSRTRRATKLRYTPIFLRQEL